MRAWSSARSTSSIVCGAASSRHEHSQGTWLARPLNSSWSTGRSAQHIRDLVALRVAWTLADLAGLGAPGPDQVTTALKFRDRGAA
ncbi:hypothetical protein GS504_03925 [Rhodococcus hoagii]|nr:hypothetical protein [Prescottella equi]NKS56684.1 hypothetical protein [Prescottella equi]NKS68782.1 hypothetical protein [Prescottella equi]